MDVGVRELKEHLSEYLERAAAGEVIRVTDHGRPKAILAPLPGVSRLAEGVEGKWISPPASQAMPRPLARVPGVASVNDTLAADRDE